MRHHQPNSPGPIRVPHRGTGFGARLGGWLGGRVGRLRSGAWLVAWVLAVGTLGTDRRAGAAEAGEAAAGGAGPAVRVAWAGLRGGEETGVRSLFGGARREVPVMLVNGTGQPWEGALEYQVTQASSALTVAWGPVRPWRKLTLPARQTVLEPLGVEFPVVRGPAPFLVRVVRGRDVIGVLPVRVYPDTLLSDLARGVGLGPVIADGVDPEMTGVLQRAGWTVVKAGDLMESGAQPRLALVGSSRGLDAARARAQAGLGVIWLQADADRSGRGESGLGRPDDAGEAAAVTSGLAALRDVGRDVRRAGPSYYPLKVGRGVLVVGQARELSGLGAEPEAQLRLMRMIRLALGRETLGGGGADGAERTSGGEGAERKNDL